MMHDAHGYEEGSLYLEDEAGEVQDTDPELLEAAPI